MKKQKENIVRVLSIHSKAKGTFQKLAFWNLQKIKVSDIDFIVVHDGKGKVNKTFSLQRTKDGMYKMVGEFSSQKSKNPYAEYVFPDGSKRVSFIDFASDVYRGDEIVRLTYHLTLPKSKKGQHQPLQIFNVDLSKETPVIVEDQKSTKKPKKDTKPKA